MGPRSRGHDGIVISDMERLLVTVARALESVPVAYAVGGSVASTRHGEPRMTNDVDVLVDLKAAEIDAFRAAFGPEWYVPESALHEAVQAAGSFNVIHFEWMDKVDFFVAGTGCLQREALARSSRVRIADVGVAFYSAEDIVLQKLDWLRRSGGVLDGQRRDVIGVLKASREVLDVEYLKRMAGELGITELLAQCLSAAGLEG